MYVYTIWALLCLYSCMCFGMYLYRDPNTIQTSSNEAYQVVKQTGGRDDGYETVTTISNIPHSSQPTAGDSLYEQV